MSVKDPLIAMDFVVRNALQAVPGSGYNEYITSFANMPWISELREMARCNHPIKQIMNHKHLKKEITETIGALSLADKAARRLPSMTNHQEKGLQDELSSNSICFESLSRLRNRLVIYDICSGKGITSFLTTFLLPEARIVMVDFNSKIHLDHLLHPRCSNITFHHMDIYKPDFESFILSDSSKCNSEAGCDGGMVVIALGLHLCGTLSLRLTSLFNTTDSIDILILSPCCMPRKGKAGQKALMEKLKRNQWCNYTYWCMSIYHSIDPMKGHRDMTRDPLVESEKSIYISSVKRSSVCVECRHSNDL